MRAHSNLHIRTYNKHSLTHTQTEESADAEGPAEDEQPSPVDR